MIAKMPEHNERGRKNVRKGQRDRKRETEKERLIQRLRGNKTCKGSSPGLIGR